MDGEIPAAEIEPAMVAAEPLVVDIRHPRAVEREHIAGSVNVPFGELARDIDRIAEADHAVTVCPHGEASVRAARLVAAFDGFDGRAESLACGLVGWVPGRVSPHGRAGLRRYPRRGSERRSFRGPLGQNTLLIAPPVPRV